ncbi:MAG: amidohydrolase family protein [Candidatus Natronoplasma sp.]
MRTYSGPFLTDEGFIQAKIEVEEGEIRNFAEGEEGKDAIIIPTFCNSHTHIADSVVDEAPDGTIAEIVGPGGLKEKKLLSADEKALISSMRSYMKDMISYGLQYFLDFREDGMEGIQLLKKAVDPFSDELFPTIMGRPKERKYDSRELDQLLKMADGVGLSSYRDWDESHLRKVCEKVRDEHKPLALHCSEDVREPIEEVLDLDVHHLVHMIEADKSDLERCAEEKVPVVVCPRSNMFFRKIPDIPAMLDSGMTLSLGTDNAMLTNGNMFSEMETAYRVAKMKGDVSPLEILMMSTWNPRKTLMPNFSEKKKDKFIILKYREGNPAYNIVINSSPKDIIETVWWKDGRI